MFFYVTFKGCAVFRHLDGYTIIYFSNSLLKIFITAEKKRTSNQTVTFLFSSIAMLG